MGEWSDYFEDFPEDNPENQNLRRVSPLEEVQSILVKPNRTPD